MNRSHLVGFVVGCVVTVLLMHSPGLRPGLTAPAADPPAAAATRDYGNKLTPIKDPKPLLADFPQYVEPVVELRRFEAPRLVDDAGADLEVRAWRWSYNARGIIEMRN